jgi:tetratricopeptide (TPR) repeat protein
MARRLRLAAAVAVLAVVMVVFFVILRPKAPTPPDIDTAALDPAVAELIQKHLRAVHAAPRSAEAWGKLGSVLMHYEFTDETEATFARAEQLAPQEPRWPYLHGLFIGARDVIAATEKFRRATVLTGDKPDAPRLRLAQNLAERGLNEEAATHFQTLLQNTPGHPAARLGLARIRQSEGRLVEATNLLANCLQDPHTRHSAHALLAMMEQALGNAPAAERAARTSSTLPADAAWPDPWWHEARAGRVGHKALLEDATVMIERGSWTEAQATLGQIIRTYPQDSEAWYLMSWIFNQQQLGAEAERALREYVRLSPSSPKGYAQLAVTLLGQRRHAEAVEVLQTGLKLKPTWRELHSNLGYACVQLGRDEDAIGHFRNALALDPNYLPTHTALAELLARRGQIEEARDFLRRALELNPTDRRAKAMLDQLGAAR